MGEKSGGTGHQGFSNLALQFTAGLLEHAVAITAVSSPTYNNYQGLLPRTLLDAMLGFESDTLVEEIIGQQMKGIFLKQKRKERERHYYQVSPQQLEDMMTFV